MGSKRYGAFGRVGTAAASKKGWKSAWLAAACCGTMLLTATWGAMAADLSEVDNGTDGKSENEGTTQDASARPKAVKFENVKPADENYLYAVNIIRKRTAIHHCTGALYAPDVVLLSASCVARRGHKATPESYPDVRIGTLAIDAPPDAEGIEVRKTKVQILHPKFDGSEEDGYANDLALLILNKPVTDHSLIKLATASCDEMEAVGWFRSGPAEGGGPHEKTLQRAGPMKRVAEKNCSQHLPNNKLSEGMFCAVGSARTVNEWDDGALLLCPGDPHTLIGLASYRKRFTAERVPYVYTNLLEHSKWIEQEYKRHQQDKENTQHKEL